jgi:uncharacterized membrane protein
MSSSDKPEEVEEKFLPSKDVLNPQNANAEEPTASQQRVIMGMVSSFSAEMYSGPIPPPSVIAGWEKLLPGAADRILKMAEKQSAHRIAIEARVIDGEINRSKTGLWLGFVIGTVMIVGGLMVIGLGHDVAGCTVIGSTLVGVVGAFIFGQKSREQERQNRTKAMSNQIAIPEPPISPTT